VERHVNPPSRTFFRQFEGAHEPPRNHEQIDVCRLWESSTPPGRSVHCRCISAQLNLRGGSDAPERSGSENRHDAVRVSKSQ